MTATSSARIFDPAPSDGLTALASRRHTTAAANIPAFVSGKIAVAAARSRRPYDSVTYTAVHLCPRGAVLSSLMRKMAIPNPIPNQSWAGPGYRLLPLSRVIEDPHGVDSKRSYFIRAADVCVYFLLQWYAPNARTQRDSVIHGSDVTAGRRWGLPNPTHRPWTGRHRCLQDVQRQRLDRLGDTDAAS